MSKLKDFKEIKLVFYGVDTSQVDVSEEMHEDWRQKEKRQKRAHLALSPFVLSTVFIWTGTHKLIGY